MGYVNGEWTNNKLDALREKETKELRKKIFVKVSVTDKGLVLEPTESYSSWGSDTAALSRITIKRQSSYAGVKEFKYYRIQIPEGTIKKLLERVEQVEQEAEKQKKEHKTKKKAKAK